MSARVPSDSACYRHAARQAGVRCQRCDRFICSDCQIIASVGFHCPECVRAARPVVVGGTDARRPHAAPRRRRRGPVVVAAPFASRPAILTGALVVSNLALFVASVTTSRSLWPGRGGLGRIMENGALWGPAVDAGGEWWRLFTSGFLHANVLHVGFNVLLLGLLGVGLERSVGFVRFALLYTAALLAGSLGALVASPRALTIGASGAVFGLMGGHLMVSRASGMRARDSGVMGLLLLNLLSTFLIPNISIGGHIGGLAGGVVAGWLLLTPERSGRLRPWAASVLTVGLMGVFFYCGLLAATTWVDPIF